MIQKASFKNFKILRDVSIDLQPFTVIVGPNASGKTTVLQGLDCLSRCLSASDGSELWTKVFQGELSTRLIYSREHQGQIELRCTGNLENREFEFGLALDEGGVQRIRAWVDRVEHSSFSYLAALRGYVRPAMLLRLEPRKLSAPSYPKDVGLSLPSDGEGLASVLTGLKNEYPERFSRIVEQLRSVVPNVTNVRIRRVKVEDRIGEEVVFDMLGATDVPASTASAGTLLTLGILTAVSVNDLPQLVLIDDVERGLHPKAMSSFVHQLRGIQSPQLQIVATSHSPYLIDCMSPEEVLLTSLDEKGYAVVRPLTDHPEYERWKGLMATGEFWSSVGEDWISEEKKATA